MTLREEIEQAVAYPLRQSEVADFRMDNMLDALEALVKNKVAEATPESVIPTVDEWIGAMDAERSIQISKGYTQAHDEEVGLLHLLNQSIDYARRGDALASSTIIREALGLCNRFTVSGNTEES